jgi:hypothetical protein
VPALLAGATVAGALVRWGDLFDVVNCAAFVAVLVWRRRSLEQLELGLVAAVGLLVLLVSVDRVAGYPNGGIASDLTPLLWAALDGAAVMLALGRRIRPKVAVLVVCLVHLPVAQLPGFALRQVAGRVTTEAPPPTALADLIYFSKVERRRAWAVGRLKGGDHGERTYYLAMVFDDQGARRTMTTETWLVTGGRMDVQEPTLSRVLLWLLTARR